MEYSLLLQPCTTYLAMLVLMVALTQKPSSHVAASNLRSDHQLSEDYDRDPLHNPLFNFHDIPLTLSTA